MAATIIASPALSMGATSFTAAPVKVDGATELVLADTVEKLVTTVVELMLLGVTTTVDDTTVTGGLAVDQTEVLDAGSGVDA